ncbi:MAG: copper chaperone PCu(A)C, partial [Balneolaceae bacterium]
MKTFILSIILCGLMAFTSCTSEKNESTNKAEETDLKAAERVRPASSGGTTVAYFSYTNELTIADTLISVNSTVAGMTQVHESYETEDGMMGMREQKNIIVDGGETLIFKQGGLHIMLMQLNRNLSEGDTVEVDLMFARSGEVKERIPVKN